jgi:DNA-binding beta-propeller fold protein YncE
VSADGQDVSVAGDSTLTHFFRDGSGGLRLDGCLTSDAATGCFVVPSDVLRGASGVAVSPDGASVYVAATPGTVSVFDHAASTGRVTYSGCISDIQTSACGNPPGSPLAGASAVAVSPDGRSVYVAGRNAPAVSQLVRAVGGGTPGGSARSVRPRGAVVPRWARPRRARAGARRSSRPGRPRRERTDRTSSSAAPAAIASTAAAATT